MAQNLRSFGPSGPVALDGSSSKTAWITSKSLFGMLLRTSKGVGRELGNDSLEALRVKPD